MMMIMVLLLMGNSQWYKVQQAPRGFGVHLPTELLHVGCSDDHIEPMVIIGDPAEKKVKSIVLIILILVKVM